MLRRLVVPAAIAGVVVASVAGIAHAAVRGGEGTAGGERLPAVQSAAGAYVTLKAAAVGSADLVDESRSKGITEANVKHPFTGIWCISGLSFTPKLAVASVDAGGWNYADNVLASVQPEALCPQGTQAQFLVYNSVLEQRLNLRVAAIFQ